MKYSKAIGRAILAAVFYALNAPLSKLFLQDVPPTMMAAFLYLGAGIGMFILHQARRLTGIQRAEKRLTKKDIPYATAMVVLDSLAPIFLMVGLLTTTSANAALLNNFEIVATSLIAMTVFHEAISRRLWIGISLVTLSSILLSIEDVGSFQFSLGSLFVLLACVCWGVENNCTRMMSESDPTEIVIIKGIGSGLMSLVIAFVIGENLPNITFVLMTMLLGFTAYGMSVYFYVYAQRDIGAARTSAYYAIAPFVSVALSFVLFQEPPTQLFVIALFVMIAGTVVLTIEQMKAN